MFCHENSFLAYKGSEEHPLRSRSEERLPLTQSHDQLSHCYVQALAARASTESFKLSPGTCGHPEFCRKPCVHWAVWSLHEGEWMRLLPRDSSWWQQVCEVSQAPAWVAKCNSRTRTAIAPASGLNYIAISQVHVSAEIQWFKVSCWFLQGILFAVFQHLHFFALQASLPPLSSTEHFRSRRSGESCRGTTRRTRRIGITSCLGSVGIESRSRRKPQLVYDLQIACFYMSALNSQNNLNRTPPPSRPTMPCAAPKNRNQRSK